MNALEFLTKTTQEGASDLFIVAGRPLSYKKNGKLIQADEERMMPDQCEAFVKEIYDLAGHRDISRFSQNKPPIRLSHFPAEQMHSRYFCLLPVFLSMGNILEHYSAGRHSIRPKALS